MEMSEMETTSDTDHTMLFVGQTFDTWESFLEVFDEHCKTSNAKYRFADCKYCATVNRRATEGEGLYNEAHRYSYAKYTCALNATKPKRVGENEEQNENSGESHIECNAHIYLASDKKLDKLVIKSLSLEHDHEEKSSAVQRERRHKRLSYAHMTRPAPEIEKPKKKPRVSVFGTKHKDKEHQPPSIRNCSVVVNEPESSVKSALVDKHKTMMNVCMQLWSSSLECSEDEFVERYVFLQSVLSWWKCGSASTELLNAGREVKALLVVKQDPTSVDGKPEVHAIIESTASEL